MPRSAPGIPRKMFPPPTTTAICTPSSVCASATSSAIRWTTAASSPEPVDASAKTSPESLSTTRWYRDWSPTRLFLLFADLDPHEPADLRVLPEAGEQLAHRRLGVADERVLDESVVPEEGVEAAFNDLGNRVLGLPLVTGELLEQTSLL